MEFITYYSGLLKNSDPRSLFYWEGPSRYLAEAQEWRLLVERVTKDGGLIDGIVDSIVAEFSLCRKLLEKITADGGLIDRVTQRGVDITKLLVGAFSIGTVVASLVTIFYLWNCGGGGGGGGGGGDDDDDDDDDDDGGGGLDDGDNVDDLIRKWLRVKQMEKVVKSFVEMEKKDVISYTPLGRVYDGLRLRLRLLREMGSFGIKPNDVTYSTLLPGLCDAAEKMQAQKLLKEMVDLHLWNNSIFLKFIYPRCKLVNMDEAANVIHGMIRLSIPTEAAHYGVLIENFCKVGVFGSAIMPLEKITEHEILLDPRSSLEMKPSAYNPMIEYLCNHGKNEKAKTLLRHLVKKDVLDPVEYLCNHGKNEKAKAFFRHLVRTDVLDPVAINNLLRGPSDDAKIAWDALIESGHIPEKRVKQPMDLVTKILEALLVRDHIEEALFLSYCWIMKGKASGSKKGKTLNAFFI